MEDLTWNAIAARWLKILAVLATLWMLYAVGIGIPNQIEAARLTPDYIEFGESFLDGLRFGWQLRAVGVWGLGMAAIGVLVWAVKP